MVSAERIQVTLQGGAPWGFRLSGGGSLPLTINKIRKKSQAHLNGLQEGDAIISINGVHVHDKSQDEALELVEKAGDSLSLEIYRGDNDDSTRDKPKKAILVPGGVAAAPVQDEAPQAQFIKTSSVDNVTSDSFETAESDISHGGFKVTVSVDEMSGSTYNTETSPGLILRATVDDVSASSRATKMVEPSPVLSVQTAEYTKDQYELESTSSLPTVMATPFTDSTVIVDAPALSFIPGPQLPGPQALTDTYRSGTVTASRSPQSRSPVPPPVSPKPVAVPPPPPISPKPSGVTSSSSYATFDDGQTRREVTREQHIQRSDDGSNSTVVQRESTLTTSNYGPSYVKSQQSSFNVVQSSGIGDTQKSSSKTTTLLNTTTTVVNKKGPTPFASSVSSNIQLPPIPQPGLSGSLSTGNLSKPAPMFKPTKYVPGSGKKEVPGLYPPTSPLVDTNVNAKFKFGKENAAPTPMFQVKKIVSENTQPKGRDIWRPNVWLPDQDPTQMPGSAAMTPTEDNPPYFTLPFAKKPGKSLVEEQKRKLLQSQMSTSSRTDHEDFYTDGQDLHHEAHHSHHKRLHVFAPPVFIQADADASEMYSPYDEQLLDDEDDASSQASSTTRRKKKLYADSAFYDAPGKNYPTITEQMKLCKKIAQSLTSAANRRARGAKMFMKRKRKSTKWIHEGQSEFSSSAGDVANLHELDSELSPDEGGNKPLLYFKIPSLKHRISSEGKQTKMALTQEEFEKLRLNSKKCDHRNVAPDTCFDIVADLKAHKGKGGRMFEKRKQRSDKFVIDESNARFVAPTPKITHPIKPLRQEKTPWEAAMENQGKVDAAFSQLTEWEKNQRLNLNANKNLDLAPLPAVKSTLRSDESPHLLKGKNFNRTARGWAGGGEYPVADQLRPVEVHFAKPQSPMQPAQSSPRQPVVSQRPQDPPQPPTAPELVQRKRNPPTAPKPQVTWQTVTPESWQPNRQENLQTNRQSNRQETWKPESQDTRQSNWQQVRQQASVQDDWRNNELAMSRQRGGGDGNSQRPKSWHPNNANQRDAFDDSYAPVDYNFGSQEYPKVAYMQPIIPGTDL
uniref:PDZ domain-containing protein n=1 Tax=Biomphalaria glabrata TaxID=6526 RepID=A0A2C9LRS9_BIOGL